MQSFHPPYQKRLFLFGNNRNTQFRFQYNEVVDLQRKKGDMMGIINGKMFIDRLNQLGNEIWLDGEKIEGQISEHPAFKGLLETKRSLYDLQTKPDMKDQMTYSLPGKKERAGLSYLQPKTKEDVKRRRNMFEHWARHTHGMMGRSPDYMNTVLMSSSARYSYNPGFVPSFRACVWPNVRTCFFFFLRLLSFSAAGMKARPVLFYREDCKSFDLSCPVSFANHKESASFPEGP